MPYASTGDYAEIEKIINEGIERTARFEARIKELEKDLKETKESLRQLQIKRRDTLQAEEDRYQIACVEEQNAQRAARQKGLEEPHLSIEENIKLLQDQLSRWDELKSLEHVSEHPEGYAEEQLKQQRHNEEKQKRIQRDMDQCIDAVDNPLKAVLYDIVHAAKVRKGLL